MSGTSAEPFEHHYLLQNCNGTSIQKRFVAAPLPYEGLEKSNERFQVVRIGNDTTYVYKDFTGNQLFSEEKILTQVYQVKDKLSIFEWKISADTVTILQYQCKKATTNFRGRTYEAYFTEDIPIPDGPAKFNGLPGLILRVKMIDDKSFYSIEATKLSITNESKVLVNPFSGEKTMRYEEFKKLYLRKYSEMEAYSQTTDGIKVHRVGVEVIE